MIQMRKKGYTLIELMISTLIISMLLIICSFMITQIMQQHKDMVNLVDRTLSDIRIVKTVEEAVDGCISVDVEPETITVVKSKGPLIIEANNMTKAGNLVFARVGDRIVVDIGGEQYWIPIIPES